MARAKARTALIVIAEQAAFEDYAEQLARAARTESERRASWDVDWQHLAMKQIESWADSGTTWDADDLRASLPPAPSRGAAGAVIAHARRLGLIQSVGFAVSSSPSRHGGLQRRWGPA